MTDYFPRNRNHLLSLLSTGVAPSQAVLSQRELRRRDQRKQKQRQPKPTTQTKNGFGK